MTTVIKQNDLIESVAAAFQYISYYHPADFLRHMAAAYAREESPAAKDAIGQILENSRLCQIGHRPICRSCRRLREGRHGRPLGRLHGLG